jgi:hypothetical protein
VPHSLRWSTRTQVFYRYAKRGREIPRGTSVAREDRDVTSLRVNFIQSGLNAFCHFSRRPISPEVHEEKARLLSQHVTMKCGHFDNDVLGVPK